MYMNIFMHIYIYEYICEYMVYMYIRYICIHGCINIYIHKYSRFIKIPSVFIHSMFSDFHLMIRLSTLFNQKEKKKDISFLRM